jgi:hypothetical protein
LFDNHPNEAANASFACQLPAVSIERTIHFLRDSSMITDHGHDKRRQIESMTQSSHPTGQINSLPKIQSKSKSAPQPTAASRKVTTM